MNPGLVLHRVQAPPTALPPVAGLTSRTAYYQPQRASPTDRRRRLLRVVKVQDLVQSVLEMLVQRCGPLQVQGKPTMRFGRHTAQIRRAQGDLPRPDLRWRDGCLVVNPEAFDGIRQFL